jgi:hypothetical protein
MTASILPHWFTTNAPIVASGKNGCPTLSIEEHIN